MNELIEIVEKLGQEEYERASKLHGPTNHSIHESYAIMLEELDESRFELKTLEGKFNDLWAKIRHNYPNSDKMESLIDIKRFSTLAACECIQVLATTIKAINSLRKENS